MRDPSVRQLERLHDITAEQLAAYPCATVGVLGVAAGNGLDLIDAQSTHAVYGYDINRAYLDACAARYRPALGDRLHLIETDIDRSLRIARVDLLIANLIIEYVGVAEFVAFAAANSPSIAVLSCVVQRSGSGGFVSSTSYAPAFAAIASVSADIDPEVLDSALYDSGFEALARCQYPLPNGKILVRQDYRAGSQPEQPERAASPAAAVAKGQHDNADDARAKPDAGPER